MDKEKIFFDIQQIVLGVHSNDPEMSPIIARHKLAEYINSIPIEPPVGMPSENSFGQWVDVNEKLPKEHIDVLGADNEGEMRVCWLDSYNNGFYMTNGEDKIPYTQIEITHWMPLPKF